MVKLFVPVPIATAVVDVEEYLSPDKPEDADDPEEPLVPEVALEPEVPDEPSPPAAPAKLILQTEYVPLPVTAEGMGASNTNSPVAES